MTTLSGPVGVRNGVTQVLNTPADQIKIIRLLWSIDPGNAGMNGVSKPPSPGPLKRCAPDLAAAIAAFQTFWVQLGQLPTADGVVDRSGQTLRKLDALAGAAPGPAPQPPPPPPPAPGFIDLNILRFQQTLPGLPGRFSIPAIVPASVMPFLFKPRPKGSLLVEGAAVGTISEFLFKIEKNGAIFWVGACVPEGTSDFSRAYIYFHPDTIGASDDAAYPSFGGRWPTVKRYLPGTGLQMAAMKKMPVIVPFMTNASRANTARTNIFADRGVETLNDIMSAIKISFGETDFTASVGQVGVASFSSGIDHLFRFADKLGGTGIIREQIDFDSAFMISAHKNAPVLQGCVNWMVTQSPPGSRSPIGWLHLPAEAFQKVNNLRNDTHSQIGVMMFQTMMMLSVMPF